MDCKTSLSALAGALVATSRLPLTYRAVDSVLKTSADTMPPVSRYMSLRVAIVSDSSMIAHTNKKVKASFVFDPATELKSWANADAQKNDEPVRLEIQDAKTFANGGGPPSTQLPFADAAGSWFCLLYPPDASDEYT